MAKKGISLPINMIVILAVAILVLVLISAFFLNSAGGNQTKLGDQSAWSAGCAQAIASGCTSGAFSAPVSGDPSKGLLIANYDPDSDDDKSAAGRCTQSNLADDKCSDNTLNNACRKVYGISDSIQCKAKCC